MSAENNGGKTGYYDLPLPDIDKIKAYLVAVKQENMGIEFAARQIQALCPQTLNDLIEHKNMEPWQHEVFKANYAIKERAKRGKFASTVREINKIIYYAGRGLVIALKEQK